MMADVEYILNDEEFFEDTVVTPEEGVNQHRKQKCFKGAVSKVKRIYLYVKVIKQTDTKISYQGLRYRILAKLKTPAMFA